MIDCPLTKRNDASVDLWAQREYVECVNRGYGFSAHEDYWFYKTGKRAYVCKAPTITSNEVRQLVSFDPVTSDWISEAVKITARQLK